MSFFGVLQPCGLICCEAKVALAKRCCGGAGWWRQGYKERYVRSLAEDVKGHLNANDLRPAYRALKKLRSKSPSRASAIRTADGRLVSDMDGQMARTYFDYLTVRHHRREEKDVKLARPHFRRNILPCFWREEPRGSRRYTMGVETWLLVATVAVLAWLYSRWRHSYWSSRGVPSPPALPFLGHFHKAFFINRRLWESLHENYTKFYQSSMFGLYEFFSPVLVTWDADIMRHILVKDSESFIDRRDFDMRSGHERDKIISEMLSLKRGAEWKALRAIMTPTFTSGKIKSCSLWLLTDRTWWHRCVSSSRGYDTTPPLPFSPLPGAEQGPQPRPGDKMRQRWRTPGTSPQPHQEDVLAPFAADPEPWCKCPSGAPPRPWVWPDPEPFHPGPLPARDKGTSPPSPTCPWGGTQERWERPLQED
ncbi:Cytochrome P450 6k1 [Chionoecetes opilio]|uniref:Cytochrome P450 6k1 n=1 Tax=Chionoecetes opilio TaxID=41210 RepID=A0A8J4YCD4_CHIOP|nr:Cytochrome P450 6k1 [Chionoecetes opilio]